ncbi:MAG: Rieske (2Fe-2S) protein [Planctomycetes bacterium]|nr:Rieske (2Fe-2S) protein [Planctomycetota bacterium]
MSIPNEGRFAKPVERRDFLGLAALGSFCLTSAAAILGSLKLPMPSVLPEADSRIKIGPPDRFAPGSATNFPERSLWVHRDGSGIYAISAICTHLGCVTKREKDGSFHCPCHGSKFAADGTVTGGPAPKGLEYLKVSRLPSGELVVDLQKKVPAQERLAV